MPSRQTLTLASAAAAGMATLARATPVVDPSCDCFTTDNGHLFTQNKIWDFAAQAGASGLGEPSRNQDQGAEAGLPSTSDYFSSAEWTDSWSIQNWASSGGSVARTNSANNVYLQLDSSDPTSTYLTLRTYRADSGAFQSTAEIESVVNDYTSMSMRSQARTSGAAGACSGLFTYKLQGGDAYESDIEILTSDPASNLIHLTRHPEREMSDGTTHYATPSVPGNGSWEDWHEYRLDWTEANTEWIVDDVEIGSMDQTAQPQPASQFLMNMWSQGNAQWEGTMAPGDEATLDLYWLQIAYNDTQSASAACSKTCDI